MFEKEWNRLAKEGSKNAGNHGVWKDEVNDGERMALIHAEISEALEALREGNPSSNKIIEFSRSRIMSMFLYLFHPFCGNVWCTITTF